MNPLSTEERRALGILLALLLIAAAARWIERPRSILGDVPTVDIAALEEASRAAKDARTTGKSTGARTTASTRAGSGTSGQNATGTKQSPQRSAASNPSNSERIDPNRASADELMTLPGVGPALAQRIIDARATAPFRTVDDMGRVRGIGPAMLARLAERVNLPRGHAAEPVQTERATNSPRTTSPTRRTSPTAPIDINRATAAELEAISGIGPALAGRLLARRDSLRGFRSYDDVDAVTGVGPALLARIRAATVLR